MNKLVLFFLVLLTTSGALAQRHRSSDSRSSGSPLLVYDLGASSGTYAGQGYGEITAGLSWYWLDWLAWRNAIFSRFGPGPSSSGLDSSVRFEYNVRGDDFGMKAYAGPGYRFASKDLTAAFAEAGIIFAIGNLHLGVGVKSMYYTNPGQDNLGNPYARTDNSYLLIIGGGGVL